MAERDSATAWGTGFETLKKPGFFEKAGLLWIKVQDDPPPDVTGSQALPLASEASRLEIVIQSDMQFAGQSAVLEGLRKQLGILDFSVKWGGLCYNVVRD